MRGIVVGAVVLGLAGTVLGIVALIDNGGGEFDDVTLELTGADERRTESSASLAESSHPSDVGLFAAEQAISGDRTGEYVRVCQPLVADDFQCEGAFLLEDGEIEIVNTQESDAAAQDEEENAAAPAVVVGGTGAYAGARGTAELRWEEGTYTLDLQIPRD